MNNKYKFDAISFGMRLGKIREFYELTQEEVADKIGVSVKSVQNWEHGDKMPGIKLAGSFLLSHFRDS